MSATAAPTVVVGLKLSLPGVGSDEAADETVAVSVMIDAGTAAGETLTVSVKMAFPLRGSVVAEQSTVPLLPAAGVVQVHPPAGVSDANVVPAGVGLESDGEGASLGPLFVTVIE
jgi:hypothetical protein